jgi:hypothetical protein
VGLPGWNLGVGFPRWNSGVGLPDWYLGVVCLDGIQVWLARMESECWFSYFKEMWFHLDK